MSTTNGQSASVIETVLRRTIDQALTDLPEGVEVITHPVDIVIDLDQKESSGDE